VASKIAKKQHYVPKFYLKEFATDETYGKKDKAQVHIYDLKKEEIYIRNIRTIAYENYIYSPTNEKNQRTAYMEDKLADIENLMSKIWKDFSNKRTRLSPSMKEAISLFIATLILRHPDNLVKNKEIKKFMFKEIMSHIPKEQTKFIYSANGKESIMEIKDMIDWHDMSENDEKKFFIENIEYLAMNIAEKLVKKKWSVITSKEKVFITSDRPVVISNPETGLLGIDSKGVIISLPISPTRLLVLEDNIKNEEDLTEYTLKKGCAPLFNKFVWANAYRYVIASKNIEDVIDEIYNFQEKQENIFSKMYNIIKEFIFS